MLRKLLILQTLWWNPEPSPTGRDAAGLLSREVTGEVRLCARPLLSWGEVRNYAAWEVCGIDIEPAPTRIGRITRL
jgi:hypothetical protein